MAEKLIGWDEDGIFLLVETETEIISALPDFADMEKEELLAYRARVTDKICALDQKEPKTKTGEARESWELLHEDLEDIRDEVDEYLDEL